MSNKYGSVSVEFLYNICKKSKVCTGCYWSWNTNMKWDYLFEIKMRKALTATKLGK